MTARAKEQIETLYHALEFVTDWSVAVDGGANIGDWTEVMAERFHTVHAFEPAVDMMDRLRARGIKNAILHEAALFDRDGEGALLGKKPRGRHVLPGSGGIRIVPLDSLGLATCGLIKLDLEGAERRALCGARQTIQHCRPVLIIEDAPELARRYGSPKPIASILAKYGYREAYRRAPDVVFVPTAGAPTP